MCVDGMLAKLITTYESTFPHAGLSYYLTGSWAEGESNAWSDVDVVIVWTRGAPTELRMCPGKASP